MDARQHEEEVSQIFDRLAELHRAGVVSLDHAIAEVESEEPRGCQSPTQSEVTLSVRPPEFFAPRLLRVDDKPSESFWPPTPLDG